MVTSHSVNNKPNSRLGIYQYDELNRIRKTQNKVLGYSDLTTNTANANPSTPWANNAPWNEDFTYDANGNIETLKRNDETGSIMDNLTYSYPASDFANQPTNRLNKVTDNTDKTGFDDFRPGQENDNYLYDASGNLRKDAQEQLDQIIWTPANKMEFLKKVVGDETIYNYRIYDGTGQLVLKWATKFVGASTTETPVNGEEYVRDPQGNVMATYQLNAEGARTLTEQTIYGSSRLGTFTSNTTILAGASDALPTTPTIYSKYGNRKYEISNHLGNLLAVVSDEKDANGNAIVLDKQDYYAFGSPLPKNNEAAMVLFEGNYAQETTSNNNSGWKEGSGDGNRTTIPNAGVVIINQINKGLRRQVELVKDRKYNFSAIFNNIPVSTISNYPITVEFVNKATGEVLVQHTTTNSQIEFDYTATISSIIEVKIYTAVPEPVSGSPTQFYLAYCKLNKEAFINSLGAPIDWESNYRYGFNTQQKQDDIYGPGNQNTALYWEYDTRLGRRWNLDPMSNIFPGWTPYRGLLNNPLMFSDFLGNIESTEVKRNKDGGLEVVDAKADGDKNIYVVNDNGIRTGEIIGQTLTDYTFLNDDLSPVKGAIINLDNHKGEKFLNAFFSKTPSLNYYKNNAGNTLRYDFKSNDMELMPEDMTVNTYYYRGMPINDISKLQGELQPGFLIIASARDIGNIAAGYVARYRGLTWQATRLAFDFYESWQNNTIKTEGTPTQSAQKFGYFTLFNLNRKPGPFKNE